MNNLVQTLNMPSLPQINDKYLSAFTGFFMLVFFVSLAGGISTQDETLKISAVLVSTFSSAFLVSIITLVTIGSVFFAPAQQATEDNKNIDDNGLSCIGVSQDFFSRLQDKEFVHINGQYCNSWDETDMCFTFHYGNNDFPVVVFKDLYQHVKKGGNDDLFIIDRPGTGTKLSFQFQ